MRAIRSVAVVLGFCLMLPACTSLSPGKERASEVYAAIVEWFASSAVTEQPLKVFIEPRGEGASISVDVQAELVSSVEKTATVRFIDTRDEALEENEDGVPVVRDDGILLAFDPVPTDAAVVAVEVAQYVDEETVRVHQFELSKAADGWTVDSYSYVDEAIIDAEEA